MALVILPFAYLLAAAGLANFFSTRSTRRLGFAAVVLTLTEHLFYLGNPIAFTNLAVWPKRKVYRLIADSDVDWGQHRDRIERWAANDGVSPERVEPIHILPGPNIYPVNAVAGVWGSWDDFEWERRNLMPRRHYGHTYLRFDVDDATFTRYLREKRPLVASLQGAALCAGVVMPALPVTDAAVVELTHSGSANDWILCLDVIQPAIVGLRSEGVSALGTVTAAGRCAALEVRHGRELWFAAEAGTHALCAFGEVRPALRWQIRSGEVRYRTAPVRRRDPRGAGPWP